MLSPLLKVQKMYIPCKQGRNKEYKPLTLQYLLIISKTGRKKGYTVMNLIKSTVKEGYPYYKN